MRFTFLVIAFLSSISSSIAQDDYPKPSAKDLLFYIQHNRGKNTFIYQTNLDKNGAIDSKNPIKITRQLFDNKGEIKPLTAIQKNFAYGLETKKIDHQRYELSLVSYPSQKLFLILNNQYAHIETTINGQQIIVQKLFIHQKEGTSGLGTKVEFISFYGKDKKNKTVEIRLDPNE